MKLLKDLLGSKKFIALLVGLVLEVLTASVLPVSDEVKIQLMTWIGGLDAAYIGGQGLADIGKEKAKVEKEPKS